MFSGKPVIGARSAATAELIKDEINGLLYRPGDPEDLANKIRSIYENPDLGKRLGGNAKTWIDAYFTPSRYTEEVLTLIGSVFRSVDPQA
jgi:glycosyltransferase involved in cell wall biosynthesis